MKYIVILIFATTQAFGHGGGLNSAGCHNDHKRGGYHCHRADDLKSEGNRGPASKEKEAKLKEEKPDSKEAEAE